MEAMLKHISIVREQPVKNRRLRVKSRAGNTTTITEVYRDWLYDMLLETMKSNPIRIGFVKTKEFNKRIEREWES
ncbi:hypothetical protein C8R30_12221 [Nitrosomonas nitrosa]|uniref:Uncharacterized protein n=1 Tax=Nitrosomonas nitrosa TaxID=52442 RepID=A0A1I4TME5_9PROT|nr:hypothetical protein C8R30_12221 [Nitrosomonas nitrosa]SFM77825.1 hypothetical protein SAMN05421880_13310 [Nitrosomonas nitrosa]